MAEDNADDEVTKPKRDTYANVVLAASFLSMFFNSSFDYATGVFHVALLDTYHADLNTTVWIGSLFFCMFGIAGPITSLVINLTSCRTCVVISGLLGLVGFSVNVFVDDIHWLFLTYALLAGMATALSHNGALVVLGFHFADNMSMACGICVCGMALGLFVHPPLCQLLIDTYGLRSAFLVIGAISFNSSVCGMLMKPNRREKEHQLKAVSGRPGLQTALLACCGDCTQYWHIMKNKSFVFFFLSVLTFGMGLAAQYLYLPDYLEKQGSSRQVAALAVSATGVGSIVSRVLTGFAAHDPRIGYGLMFASLNGLMGGLSLLIPLFTSSTATIYLYGVFLGLYTGGSWALLNPISLEILGIHFLSTGFGAIMFAVGIGMLIGPPFAGVVFEVSRRYYGVYVFSSCMFFLCTFCGFLSTMFRTPREVTQKKRQLSIDQGEPFEMEKIVTNHHIT